ncbi:hypothetical protein TRFO_40601 [Tritrichomonas foetus]|uniref:Uncharacterized protein n=1 Tax=Tritrichomonas foetus TaxID=1144522 RepID=A0A1J4J108_9EUKA|nr:hypothetical protein TRFO_40601 [Tritrichomonas foetus]|eukprot:OHS93098.1 hypothetical protein TRFO_40601 [Tritrichomonas foetus]
MNIGGPFLRVQLDESILDKVFKQVNDKLNKHEDLINELFRLLKDKPDRKDLDDLHDKISKEIDDKTAGIYQKIDDLESRLNNRIKELEENFENRLMDTANMLNMSMRQKIDDLEHRIPNGGASNNEIVDRLQNLEETVFNNGKKLHNTRESVQQIASAIALFNNTNAKLDDTLYDTLKKSVNSVTGNIQALFAALQQLKDKVDAQAIIDRRKQEPITVQHESTTNDFDISSIRPYPSMVAHWRDPPELPPIHPFLNLSEVVDYVYRLVPKLQAHLTAMHGKIVENASELLGKVDKSLVEKMFEKFQSVIGEMAGRVDELKDAVEQTATRDEINEMVEDILNSMNQEGQTAIGRMRCMACGREIPQVVGAITEEEAQRILGPPPNSQVYNGKSTKVGVLYREKEGFDSGIVESPRSIRPFKPATRVKKAPKNGRISK